MVVLIDLIFVNPGIRKEEKMGVVIAVLVVIALVFGIVYLVQRT